jgi:antitoxin component YwqK of YwqJK toxin-antitoxin module
MQCQAITNSGKQCSRKALSSSKYCWQHQNYKTQEIGKTKTKETKTTNQYFQNVPLLQNTLLTYFSSEEDLKNLNKQFQNLNYEKYNTHIQPHGVVKTYYSNGKLNEIKTYKNGVLDGLSELFYKTGKLWIKSTYKNGKLEGLWEDWYENGVLRYKINYKNGKLEGLWEDWYENGKISERYNYKNDKLDGLSETWHNNGQLYDRSNYINGELNGLSEEWYDNGQLENRVNYINGHREGLWEDWFENGQLSEKVNYKNGELEGLYESWFDNGQLSEKINYKNSSYHGLYESFDNNGKLKKRSNYLSGELNGLYESYDENGNLIEKLNYINGEPVEEKNNITDLTITEEKQFPKFKSLDIVEYFRNPYSGINKTPERASNEEKIIDAIKPYPIDLKNISKEKLAKLQNLLEDDFYQYNVPEGIMYLTSAILLNKTEKLSDIVDNWLLNPKFLGIGENAYAISSNFGDAKNLFAIKTVFDPREDDLIHELFVGLFGTNQLRKQVPNFAFLYGGFVCRAPTIGKNNIITEMCGNGKVVHYVIYENIPGTNLTKGLINFSASDFIAIYLQILLALRAGLEYDFTHYDLHEANVILRKPFDTKFAIPYQNSTDIIYIITDMVATMIDYGYAHIKYQDVDYGKYGLEKFCVFPDKSFPLYDAYKLLLSCATIILLHAEKTLNYDVYDQITYIFEYFTDDLLNTTIVDQEKYFLFSS